MIVLGKYVGRLSTSRLLISPSEKLRYEVMRALSRNERLQVLDLFSLQEIKFILVKLAQNVDEVVGGFLCEIKKACHFRLVKILTHFRPKYRSEKKWR